MPVATDELKKKQLEWFEIVWKDYPRRVGKKAALRHFVASIKNELDMYSIRTALKHYLASDRVRRGWIKDGSTWFNQWRDWFDNPDASIALSNNYNRAPNATRCGHYRGKFHDGDVERCTECLMSQ